MEGFWYFLRGLAMITRPGLRRYVLVPVMISTVIFGGGFYLGYDYISSMGGGNWWHWMSWLRWLLLPLFVIAFALVGNLTFTFLANLVASSFNTSLAARVEEILLEGATGSIVAADPITGYPAAIWDELQKMSYALAWGLPVIPFLFIPVLNVVVPFVYGAWIMAVQYTDYPMGNHGIAGAEVRRRLRQRRFAALTFGGTVAVFSTLPILNILAMPAAVAGATIFWVELLRHDLGKG